MRRQSSLGIALFAAPLAFILLIPIAALLASASPSAIVDALQQPDVLKCLWLSLKTTVFATVISAIFGVPLAFLLSKTRWRAASVLFEIPLVLPPAVVGLGLLLAFAPNGPFGKHFSIALTTTAVVLAQIAIGAPLLVRAAMSGFDSVSPEFDDAAKMEGASLVQRMQKVFIPLARPAVLAGIGLCWARAVGEFGATLLFAGNLPGVTQTAPLAIYADFAAEFPPRQGVAISIVMLFIAACVLALFHLFGSRFAIGETLRKREG